MKTPPPTSSQAPVRRMLCFAHYNMLGGLSEHVLHTLRHCREVFDHIVVVSNSVLSGDQKASLCAYVDRVIVRENAGFDFCAWRDCLQTVGWDTVRTCDSLTLMNDTCFGPVFDLGRVYREMELTGVDFWGLTAHPRGIERSRHFFRMVPEHIQSYFMVFRRSVLEARVFSDFWDQVAPLTDVWDVIVRYEMRLTRRLAAAGFTYRAFVGPEPEVFRSTRSTNLAHYEPVYLLERGVPFIKIKSFILSPQRHAALDILTDLGVYPTSLISAHITTHYRPDLAAQLACQTCPIDDPDTGAASSLRVALFLHVRSGEAFERYQPCIDHVVTSARSSPDVYVMVSPTCEPLGISHDPESGKPGIKAVLACNESEHPWQQYADLIDGYDLVAYFDVRAAEAGGHKGARFRDRYICRSLLAPLDQIVASFHRNPMLGIVGADLPYSDICQEDRPDRRRRLSYFKAAATQLQCKCRIDTQDVYSLVTPYGSSFWCRPSALQPLRALVRNGMDAGAGMRETNADKALALLPVYVAWAEGYDYRFAVARDRLYAGQQMQLLRDESQRATHKYVTSTSTWWLGHLFLYVPYCIALAIKNRRDVLMIGEQKH